MHTQSPGISPSACFSLEPEVDLAHTHQCCDCYISQAAEQSGESQHVLTNLHGCGMEGKRREIASFADPGGPRAPLWEDFDDPEGPNISGSEEECAQRDVVHRLAPCCRSLNQSSVVRLAVLSLVRSLWWKMGTMPGRRATSRKLWEDFARPNINGPLCAQRAGAFFFWFRCYK